MKKILLILITSVSAIVCLAQVSGYTFSSSVDTYTELTGGTVLGTATLGGSGANALDDVLYNNVTLPFPFLFNGRPINAVTVSSNGYLIVGGTTSLGYTPISSTTTADGAISILGRDLQGNVQNESALGEIRYGTIGSGPNQEFVIQWKNFIRYTYGGSTESYNFQIHLVQGSNNIKYVYGPMTVLPTSITVQVGLRGTSNTDFNNRTTTTDWSATTAGTSNTDSCTLSSTVFPVSGTTFTFSLIISNPPNPAVLVWPLNGSWAFNNDTLKWASGGNYPLGYDVYLDTVDGTTLVSNDQPETTYTPVLLPGTTYYWKVVPYNDFGSAASCPVWSFKTPTVSQLAESFENTAFPPTGWTNPGIWSRVTSYYKHGIASAYKSGSTTTQYILSTPKVTITSTSTLDFWAFCSSTTGILQVVYSPDRESWSQIGSDITFAAINTWYHQEIDLSSLAGNNYYLGFRTAYSGSYYVDAVFGPEFTAELPGAPTLSSPADLATGVNEYTTFTWTAPTTGGVPTGYKLYCDTNTTPTTMIADVTTLTYTLTTPLNYNTTYYWTVSAYNNTGESPTAPVRSFTTRSDPTIYTLPYTESFEEGNTDGSTNIANWAQVAGPEFTNRYWTANSTQTTYNRTPRTGSFNVTLQWNGSAWLFRPVSLTGGTTYEFEAYARQDGSNSADATLGLYYGTAATIAAMTPITGQVGLVNGDYQRIYGVFSPATSGIYYLGIKGWININPWYISLDDVTIREAPTAPVFSYSPTSINFGLLMQNVPSTPANVTVTNLGGGTIHIESSNISITGPNAAMFSFSDANLPADLNAGQSVIIPVTAIVTQEGPVSATLIITYEGTPYEVALSAEGLSSEIVIIGTGTDDLSLPIEPYYGYSYSQSIFLQSEINMARPIEKIYYYWNGAAATVNSNNWTVYMGHTPNTSFDSGTAWIPLSNLTEVFSGTVTLPAIEGWVEIILTTPFTYNNVDNLVVAVDENADLYDSNNEYFYCTSELKTNRSIRYYTDGTNPDPLAPPTGTPVAGYPNIMLKFEEEQPPLPVELSSFTAILTDQFYVQLTWISQSETNLSGYRVYRNEEKSLDNAILITPTMIPATNTTQEHCYTIVDSEVENNVTYYYWLESVDYNNSEFHGPVIVTVEGNVPPVLPEVTTLNNAYPNPFRANNSTKIEVGIKAGETGTLTIYNIRGEVVKAVKLTQGYHTINWDGIDSKGKTCGSGIYFYRLNTPSLNQIKKMVIIK